MGGRSRDKPFISGCRGSATPDETSYCPHQFCGALLPVGLLCPHYTVMSVLVQQTERHFIERGLNCTDLGKDVDAVAVSFDHTRQATNLPLDALEACEELVLSRGISTSFERCHSRGL